MPIPKVFFYVVDSLTFYWSSPFKFSPPQYRFTDRGANYLINKVENGCTLFIIGPSLRTSHAVWTNGLVEVQNKKFGTHLRKFLYDAPDNWSIQVHFYAYAPNTQPLLQLLFSQSKMVFHKQPRIPLKCQLQLSRNEFSESNEQYCSDLPPHSGYQSSDLKLLLDSIWLKPFLTWFLAIETVMVQFFS